MQFIAFKALQRAWDGTPISPVTRKHWKLEDGSWVMYREKGQRGVFAANWPTAIQHGPAIYACVPFTKKTSIKASIHTDGWEAESATIIGGPFYLTDDDVNKAAGFVIGAFTAGYYEQVPGVLAWATQLCNALLEPSTCTRILEIIAPLPPSRRFYVITKLAELGLPPEAAIQSLKPILLSRELQARDFWMFCYDAFKLAIALPKDAAMELAHFLVSLQRPDALYYGFGIAFSLGEDLDVPDEIKENARNNPAFLKNEKEEVNP